MKFKATLVAMALLVAVPGMAHAVPSLSFLIDGDTFSVPFAITNTSTGGEKVTRFQLDLIAGLCYDTVAGGPCNTSPNSATAFAAVGGTGATTGLVGSPVIADGTSHLDISFTGFDPTETFQWDIDVDHADPGSVTVFGNEMIGSTAIIDFSDGQRLTGVLAAVPGNSDASQFTVTGVTVTPGVPNPAALSLLGLGLATIGFITRKRA